MTAPDSRDSVERVVAEMREELSYSVHVVEVSVSAFRAWADRLQVLARGPQQAGGEVASVDALAQLIRAGDGNHRLGAGALAELLWPHYAALQAEVARLRESLSGSRNVLDLLRSAVIAGGVSKFTHVESRSGSLVCVQSTINAIDAALNGGQDDNA